MKLLGIAVGLMLLLGMVLPNDWGGEQIPPDDRQDVIKEKPVPEPPKQEPAPPVDEAPPQTDEPKDELPPASDKPSGGQPPKEEKPSQPQSGKSEPVQQRVSSYSSGGYSVANKDDIIMPKEPIKFTMERILTAYAINVLRVPPYALSEGAQLILISRLCAGWNVVCV